MCCGKPSQYEMEQPTQEWWRSVRLPGAARTFGSMESAEKFLAQDIEKLSGNDLEFYRRLLYQKETAEE